MLDKILIYVAFLNNFQVQNYGKFGLDLRSQIVFHKSLKCTKMFIEISTLIWPSHISSENLGLPKSKLETQVP